MKEIKYRKSLKKMAITAGTAITIIISQLFVLDLTNDFQFYSWLAITLTLSIGVISSLKRQATAKCPYCDADLFEIIGYAKNKQIPFNFCPSCGNKVTIKNKEKL